MIFGTEDRRVVYVRATERGRKTATDLIAPLQELYDAQLGHLSEQDLDTLNDLLVRAREHIDQGNP